MDIYIASHCRWAGMHVASVVLNRGHKVTSRWIYKEFKPTHHHDEKSRLNIAQEDFEDVARSDGLLLISGPDKYPGGKFVEAGIALARGIPIVIIGRRENMLMWHPLIKQADDPETAVSIISRRDLSEFDGM